MKKDCEEAGKVIRNFFWRGTQNGGRCNLVNSEVSSLPISKGGLSAGNLRARKWPFSLKGDGDS